VSLLLLLPLVVLMVVQTFIPPHSRAGSTAEQQQLVCKPTHVQGDEAATNSVSINLICLPVQGICL